MTRSTAAIALALLMLVDSAAAQEVVMDAGRIAHALDRLSNTGRVLYVAAHPDDENTRLLAYLANARHVNATYLSMTRGGGGQNLIGREQDALLDVLRTQELLAARKLDGAQQRFTRMRDFGYSKSANETLAIWGHDEALADVVWTIRSVQPDVIITRFDEQPPNHGHHTASAILAREAFSAAADPQRFPEQLAQGVQVWQARRLLHNVPSWRDAPPPPKDALVLDVGGYDARLGLSYGELAARSRSQHKSQGFGALGERGELLERFVHVAGTAAQTDILEAVPTSWARFGAAGQRVDALLTQARQTLHRDHPERVVSTLMQVRAALAALPANDVRVSDAQQTATHLIVAAAGLYARATATRASCAPDSTLPVHIELIARRASGIKLRRVVYPDGSTTDVGTRDAPQLGLDEKRELNADVHCPSAAPISAPYWMAEAALAGRQIVSDPRLLNDPQGRPPLTASVDLEIDGQPLRIELPLVNVWLDRVHGERERRVLVVPPATVTPTRDALMFPNHRTASLTLRVRAGSEAVAGRVLLELPEGWRSKPAEHSVTLAHAGDEVMLEFLITPPTAATTPNPQHATQTLFATPSFEAAGQRWSWREDVIDHPHVPLQMVLQPAKLRLVPLELTAPHGLIGYVEGTGDTIAADLQHIGARVELLSDAALLQGELSRFSAIVLGVRAYNTRDVLRAAHARLMQYVEAGGTLLVQYVTRSTLSPLEMPVGPYPLEVGRGRVTDETAQLHVLDPKQRVLRTPHRITEADFANWVQERGLYFAEHWDERYHPVFEISDPDEAPQRGALLIARHGRGVYVYTGLAFFRQLPAGVPGAYRLFLNLLGKPGEAPP